MEITWAYGVTTVPERRETHLPATLASLRKAGFDNPRLFVDGDKDGGWYRSQGWENPLTCRYPRILAAGNWVLSIYELYIRQPDATYYALFQDDFLTYPNLRQYLETCSYHPRAYWNLYTAPSNQSTCPLMEDGRQKLGWYKSNQNGRGAVALVFNRETLATLLGSNHLAIRPQDPIRGWRSIDGGILEALKKAGWLEHVHNPSLVLHTGKETTIDKHKLSRGKNPDFHKITWSPHYDKSSFRGEDFDALHLLREIPSQERDLLGENVYNDYDEPLRSQLVADWRTEIQALQTAIRDDEARILATTNPRVRRRLVYVIEAYRKKLEATLKNFPPYFSEGVPPLFKGDKV